MAKYLFIGLLVLFAAVLLVGCGKDRSEQEQTAPVQPVETEPTPIEPVIRTHTVRILGANGFDPAELRISRGDTVIFINQDPRKKATVLTFQLEDTRKFVNTDLIKPDAQYEQIFAETGTYYYWTEGYAPRATLIVE